MNFDFKITVWERVNVPIEQESLVLEGIKTGKISCSNDIYTLLTEKGYSCDKEYVNCEIIEGSDEQMNISENGGSSTIEVITDDETLFANGEE